MNKYLCSESLKVSIVKFELNFENTLENKLESI